MKRSRFNNLSIQNFKAFGDMVDVPIRPITLIFGENSSGKSSILHSLLFLNQMQHQPQHQLADITYTQAGGNSVDLGGLPQLKYGQNNERALSFLVNGSTDNFEWKNKMHVDISFKYIFSKSNELSGIELVANNRSICKFSKYKITYNFSQFEFELEINFDNAIWLLQNSDVIFDKNNSPSNKTIVENMLNSFGTYTNHETILKAIVAGMFKRNSFNASNNELNFIKNSLFTTIRLNQCYIHSANNSEFKNHKLYDYFENSLRMRKRNSASDSLDIPFEVAEFNDNPTKAFINVLYSFFHLKYSIMTQQMSYFTYLGPIRTIPTRNFDTLDSISRDPSTGSMAWETLTTNEDARNQVNQWLARFGTNKQIVTEQLIDSAQLRQIIAERTNLEQILPAINTLSKRNMLRFYDVNKHIYLSHRDLGVGISQVLPVVVNCVINKMSMVLIEQPELHLHPRLQGDLADLFIDTAIKGDQHNTYVIETHSEHIIRRVMRRIREDRNKSAGETRITKDDVAILYVAAGPNGSTVTHLRLDDEGDLIDEWPNGFFEESFRDDMAGR